MGAVHVSSVPKVLGDLGTAPWSSVENEKWAETLPSMSGRSVSSSRYSSSAASTNDNAAKPRMMNKEMRCHFILCFASIPA
jgi:hypothetical protein